MQKTIFPVEKQNSSVCFVECTELNWNGKYANGLFFIFFKGVVSYLGVIVKLRNYECMIYIFIGGFPNGTPKIFNKSQYHCWYK